MALQILINEPTIGWTDRTGYLWLTGSGISYSQQRGERGPAKLPFIIAIDNPYEPEIGRQVKIIDNGTTVFVGTIEDYEYAWVGQDGWRGITLNCVTLKQSLDTVRVPPRTYNNQYAGDIVTDLLTTVATGFPFALGTISDGPLIASLNLAYDLLSDVIQQLATLANFIWDIDPGPATPEFYFRAPNVVTSPVTIVTSDLQWESLNYSARRSEFRDRQIVKLSWDAFAPSTELFAGDGHTTTFALRNPIDHLVKATLTMNTQATATGLYTGQPGAGDILSVGNLNYEFVSSLDNTQFGQVLIGASADATYENLADAINATMDLAGSAYSLPTWENSVSTAEAFAANNKIVITAKVPGTAANNLGLAADVTNFAWYSGSETGGSAPPQPTPTSIEPVLVAMGTLQYGGPFPSDGDTFVIGSKAYTFRTVINNATPNEVLIISTSQFGLPGVDQMQAVIDAINANPLTSGTSFSSATTANTQATAGVVHQFAQFTLINPSGKFAWFELFQIVSGTVTITSSSSVAFRWQLVTAIFESAGESFDPNNPNPPQIGSQSSTTQEDPEATVSWVTGSTLIVAKEAPAAGVSLRVDYYRLAANMIAVEDSALVAARALAEGGTGRYDQISDDSQNTNAFEGLARAQAALTVYGEFPQEVSFDTYTAGLVPGDLLPMSLVKPVYAPELINAGTWLIQEVTANYVPAYAFKYSVTCISTSQVQSDVQFVERLAQTGGSGLGSTGPMLAQGTSQGSGGGGSALEPVEEDLTDQIDGFTNIFLLRWVPREFPYPTHQLVLLNYGGAELTQFAYGSPAIGPDFSIVDNQITLRFTPPAPSADYPGSWLKAFYYPDVGVPQLGTLQDTAVFGIITQLDKQVADDPVSSAIANVPNSGSDVTIFAGGGDGFAGWARKTDEANWNISSYGGSLPNDLASLYVDVTQWGSTSWNGADYLYMFDLYLDFFYSNADPSQPDIVLRYRPTGASITNDGSQSTIEATAGPPPTATIYTFHTSGLSNQGYVRYTGWQLSQRFYDV